MSYGADVSRVNIRQGRIYCCGFSLPAGYYINLWPSAKKDRLKKIQLVKFSPAEYSSRVALAIFKILVMFAESVELLPDADHRNDSEMNSLMSSRSIKLFHLNICGFATPLFRVVAFFHEFEKIDIFTLSETHIVTDAYDDKVVLVCKEK